MVKDLGSSEVAFGRCGTGGFFLLGSTMQTLLQWRVEKHDAKAATSLSSDDTSRGDGTPVENSTKDIRIPLHY